MSEQRDIVDLLRGGYEPGHDSGLLCEEAADEIASLRNRIEMLTNLLETAQQANRLHAAQSEAASAEPVAWQFLSSAGWVSIIPTPDNKRVSDLKNSGYTLRPLYAVPYVHGDDNE